MKFLIVMDSGKEYEIEIDSIDNLREKLTNEIEKGVLLVEDGKILISPSHISSIEVITT